jgi:hypothetical protein
MNSLNGSPSHGNHNSSQQLAQPGATDESSQQVPPQTAGTNTTSSDPGTFSASFEDAKTVVNMLQSLATGKRDQFACVVVSDTALRFSVETQSKNLLGVAYITVSCELSR